MDWVLGPVERGVLDSVVMSTVVVVHCPQDNAQARCIYSGFSIHSLFSAQMGQSLFSSIHAPVVAGVVMTGVVLTVLVELGVLVERVVGVVLALVEGVVTLIVEAVGVVLWIVVGVVGVIQNPQDIAQWLPM